MPVADTLKALIAILVSDISAVLTTFVRNRFLFKGQFICKKDLENSKSNTFFFFFFLSTALAAQQEAVKGLCCRTEVVVIQACAADPKRLFQNFKGCKSWLHSRSPKTVPAGW